MIRQQSNNSMREICVVTLKAINSIKLSIYMMSVFFLQLISLDTIHESKQIREPSDKFLMHI